MHLRRLLHKNEAFTPAFSVCSGKDKHARLMELGTMLPFPFLPRSASDTLSELDPRGKLVFLTRRPDLIGHGRIFYSITKTELFKLTFQKGKRVAGSGGAAELPRKCHNINELL